MAERPLTHKQVDIAMLLGLLVALALVAAAIAMTGRLTAFFDLASVFIVIGGTLALTMASYTLREFLLMPRLIAQTIYYRHYHLRQIAEDLLRMAENARRGGLLKLQDIAMDTDYPRFFRQNLQMAIDAVPIERVSLAMQQDIAEQQEQHALGSSVLRRAADIAPAMGLIGTLIGLVQMLGNLENPGQIGPAMAVALLTTLYGAIMAYMIFLPLASKLDHNSATEAQALRMYQESILSMQRADNPRQLEITLNSILLPHQRVQYFDPMGM